MDDKYIVFKRDDWEELLPSILRGKAHDYLDEVPDAVVIRRQDVFAPPALDSYANSITVAMSLIPETGEPGVKERLSVIADYFHEQAHLSWDADRKLPD